MSQQQTRRLRRVSQPKEPERTKVLSQISPPSIAAASLAAVTSFLLSSKLGLTGSLIGAGIAAAVSTTASQLYNAMIKRSMETVQDMSGHVAAMVGGDEHAVVTASGRTQVRRAPVRLAALEATEVMPTSGSPVAPRALRTRAARRRGATLAQRTFVVALATALVALAIYGVILHTATQGRGIGPTTIIPVSEAAEARSTETSDAAASDGYTETTSEQEQGTTATNDGGAGETVTSTDATATTQEQVTGTTTDAGTTGADTSASTDLQAEPTQDTTDTATESGSPEAQAGQPTTTTNGTSASQTGLEAAV